MEFKSHIPEPDVVINELYTLKCFEFANDFLSEREGEGFWELMYVDKGKVFCVSGEKNTELTSGNAFLFPPGKRRVIYSDGVSASDAVIAAFECESRCIDSLANKAIGVTGEQKRLISKIITEYSLAFDTDNKKEKPNRPIGARQLIRQYLSEFLILALRQDSAPPLSRQSPGDEGNATVNKALEYMGCSISGTLTVQEIAHHCGTGTITVNRLFRKHLNTTPINYFIHLKIDIAKKHLRENNYNVTQIAEELGYANIHYFSRQFKSITGMSPTEYVRSVRAIAEGREMY